MLKRVDRSGKIVLNAAIMLAGTILLCSSPAKADRAEDRGQALLQYRQANFANNKSDARRELRQQNRLDRVSAVSVPTIGVYTPLINTNSQIRFNSGIRLDLGSQERNVVLGGKLFENNDSVTIEVGGATRTFTQGSQVTAAEYVAIKQAVLGNQQIVVDGHGIATGGTVDLGSITARDDRMRASDLVNPVGVSITGDFGRGSTFQLSGDLTNQGSVYAYSSRGGHRGGTIHADNIINQEGALISSVSDLGRANRVDLTLRADNSLVNFGTIESSGDLTLDSASVRNGGSISAQSGNVNFDSASALEINNNGGTISALNAINLRTPDYTGTFNTNLYGGDLLSREVNMNSGHGTADVNVNELTGAIGQTGTAAHVMANTDTLVLGKICLTGDPTYYNTGGGINITGNIEVAEALTIVAFENIEFDNGADIIARNATQGFPVTLISGANITATNGGSNTTQLPPLSGNGGVTINGGNPSTGFGIRFNDSNSQIITRPSGVGNYDGGDVLLAAFGGNVVVLGTTDSHSIETGGTGFGNNGNITIIAPQTSTLPAMNTTGGLGLGGVITAYAAQPVGINVQYQANGRLVLGSPEIVPNEFLASNGEVRFSGGTVDVGNAAVNAFANGTIRVDSPMIGRQVNLQSTNILEVFNTLTASQNTFLFANSIRSDAAGTQLGTVTSPNVILSSSGDIGQIGGTAFRVDADVLTFNATNEVNIVDIDDVTILPSQSQSMAVRANGPLTVAGSLTTSGGNLVLSTSQGQLTVNANIGLAATNGALSLINDDTNKKTSKILIGTGSVLVTSGTGGNVFISIGEIDTPVAGKQPKKNVQASNPGGNIFWGKKGITANAPVNSIDAIGSDVIFNNFVNKKNIILNGDVAITAN